MRNLFFLSVALIFFCFSLPFSSAQDATVEESCTGKSVVYRGECSVDGTIHIENAREDIVFVDRFSTDGGCVNGEYWLRVLVGAGPLCPIHDGDELFFFINDDFAARSVISTSVAVHELDLTTRSSFASSTTVSVLCALCLFVCLLLFFILRGVRT